MKKIVWTFGLISGGILSLMMLVTIPFESRIGFDRGLIVGYTTMVLSFLLVFFGIRSYRDNVGHGSISFGRAFAVGALITVISSVCYVATWEVMYFKFTPDHMEKYTAYTLEKERRSGATEAAIQQKAAEMREFTERYNNNLLFNAAMTFIEPLPVGLVIALVSAGVLRRKRREEGSGELAASVV